MIRPLVTILLLPFSHVGCTAMEDPPTREELEHDLQLTIAVDGAVRHAWWPFGLQARLRNRSQTHSYQVVLPGDGSEAGWREPTITLAGRRVNTNGEITPLEHRSMGRCGNYDADWRDEVRDLAPGQSIALSWLPSPSYTFDFGTAGGRVELWLTYRYDARPASIQFDTKPLEGDPLGALRGYPKFELRSNVLTFTFDEPSHTQVALETDLALDLELHGKQLGLLDVTAALRNSSTTTSRPVLTQRPGTQGYYGEPIAQLEYQAFEHDAWQTISLRSYVPRGEPTFDDWRERVHMLEPGANLPLAFPELTKLMYVQPEPGQRVRIRATYAYSARPANGLTTRGFAQGENPFGAMASVPPFRIESPWIEFRIE